MLTNLNCYHLSDSVIFSKYRIDTGKKNADY